MFFNKVNLVIDNQNFNLYMSNGSYCTTNLNSSIKQLLQLHKHLNLENLIEDGMVKVEKDENDHPIPYTTHTEVINKNKQ